MSKKIYEIVDRLPKGGLTVTALKTLDKFIPGQWENLVGGGGGGLTTPSKR